MKKYYLYSTAEGCTSNLWESAVYDDFCKKEGMQRVDKPDNADFIILNTCAVTPHFEERSEKHIKKMIATQLGPGAENKKLIIAGCYSAIRNEKLQESFEKDSQVSHVRPIEMKKMAHQLGVQFDPAFKTIQTNRFDDVSNCSSTFAHKLTWNIRKIVRKIYGFLKIEKSYLLNFLDTMIFSDGFFVIDVGHGCAGGCTFCSIKQSRGTIKSGEEDTILANLNRGLNEGYKNFWLLATDIGAWGLDRNKNPADLLAPVFEKKEDFRIVLNYIEPRWLLKYEQIHKFLQDPKAIGVCVPIQSGSTRLVKHSGRNYDPTEVMACVAKLKKNNTDLIVKTNIIVGLPSETWMDFFYSVMSVLKFDVTVPVVFGVRPGTRAEKDPEQISTFIKIIRMIIISFVTLSWMFYLCAKAFVKDICSILLRKISRSAALPAA